MKTQKGFTLVELVVIIVILGILAAVAIPRFADLQSDARMAKIDGALGGMKAAASLAHAMQLVANLDPSDSVTMEGMPVTMIHGYPTADDLGIVAALGGTGFSSDFFITGGDTGAASVLTVATDAGNANCKVTYTSPVEEKTAPVYSVSPARTDCN